MCGGEESLLHIKGKHRQSWTSGRVQSGLDPEPCQEGGGEESLTRYKRAKEGQVTKKSALYMEEALGEGQSSGQRAGCASHTL